MPVDAKFPQDDYERLLSASEVGDVEAAAEASKALESRIRSFAKTIRTSTSHPHEQLNSRSSFCRLRASMPRSCAARVVREHSARLSRDPDRANHLHGSPERPPDGFRSLAIEKRSGEVWKILGAVRNEFGKYNDVVDRLARQLSTAAKSVESLGVRTRAMDRRLRDVEVIPEVQILLGAGSLTRAEIRYGGGVIVTAPSTPLHSRGLAAYYVLIRTKLTSKNGSKPLTSLVTPGVSNLHPLRLGISPFIGVLDLRT